jgi:nucleotide-binding universal stress UspA family protein
MMKVLVCTDFSAASAAGEREAAARFPDAELVVFHAIDEDLARRILERTGQDPAHLRSEMTNFADTRVDEIVGRLRSQGRRAIADIAHGTPPDMALASAARHRAALMVIGVMPAARFFRVSVVRAARLPVLIVPDL